MTYISLSSFHMLLIPFRTSGHSFSHSYFNPPYDAKGGRVRNWHRPSDVLTFASCDPLDSLFCVCVCEEEYADVSIGENIYNIFPLDFPFSFLLDLCVNKSQWFIRSLPPILYRQKDKCISPCGICEWLGQARPGQRAVSIERALTATTFVCVCVCWLFLYSQIELYDVSPFEITAHPL